MAWSQSLLAPTSPGPEDVAAAFGLIEPGDDDFVMTPQSQSYQLTDVVVTGAGWAPSSGPGGGGWGTGGSYDGNPELTINPSPGPGTMYDPGNWWDIGPTDEDEILIHVDLGREPTDEEKVTINLFAQRVGAADAFVKSLNDTEKITLRSGAQVSGADLKAMWSKLDFVIKPTGTPYVNLTTQGQVDYNGGDPLATFSFDTIKNYNFDYQGGMFLPLHEIGHLLSGGTYRDEIDANDIARAIANRFGVGTHLDTQNVIYSSQAPLLFGP